MQIRSNEKYTEINIVLLSSEIDDAFHKYITDKTGVTISHEKIYGFVGKFIREHNVEELSKEAEWKRVNKSFEKWGKENDDKSLISKFIRLWK